MVPALIMPRSATMQARSTPKRRRSRSTTGSKVVTSAVLPGHRKEAIGRSCSSSTMPSTTWLSCGRKSLVWPNWPSVAPPLPSKYSEVVSKKATEIAPMLPCAGMTIGAGDHQPVHHRQVDRAFDVEAEASPGQMPAQHHLAAGLPPEMAEHQVG